MTKPGEVNAVSPEALRAELNRILSSRTFASSTRLRDLLKFLADRHLDSASGPPKEFEIAVHVFDRPDTFDSSIDSLVRVHATRLRTKLREFYETESEPNAFQIQIPKGSYALEILRSEGFPSPASQALDPQPLPPTPPRRYWGIAAVGLLAIAVGAAFLIRRSTEVQPRSSDTALIRITRNGAGAGPSKFSADGKSIYYSVETPSEPQPTHFSIDVEKRRDPVRLGYVGLKLYSVSSDGLIFLDSADGQALKIAPSLGAPAEVKGRNINTARWHQGKLLVVRNETSQESTLEMPMGNVLARASSTRGAPFQFAFPSHDGRFIAFGRPGTKATDYDLAVLDVRDRSTRLLLPGWFLMGPIACLPSGEFVVGGRRRGEEPRIYAVDPATGKFRVLRQSTQNMVVDDVRPSDGLMLVRELVSTFEVHGRLPGDASERLMQLGGNFVAYDISADGSKVILGDGDGSATEADGVYSFEPSKSQALVKLGTGLTPTLSPDGRHLLLVKPVGEARGIEVLDLATRKSRNISVEGHRYQWPKWAPDGRSFFFRDTQGVHLQSLETGKVARLDRLDEFAVMKDGRVAVQIGSDLYLHELGSAFPGKLIGTSVLRGSHLIPNPLRSSLLYGLDIARDGSETVRLFSIDPASGAKQPLRDLNPGFGGTFVYPIGLASTDGKYYVYSVVRARSTLFLAPQGSGGP